MNLICVNNKGFEDILSLGSSYYATDYGVNSYKVEVDSGKELWLGDIHFAIVITVL